ncbi:MAG: hypothetical protein FWF10_04940 [Clostridiales bacterium]|nr:hypothetical protein [Clostridiales bacterium]
MQALALKNCIDSEMLAVTQVTGPSVNGTQSTVTNTYDTPQNLLRQTKLQQSGLGDVDYTTLAGVVVGYAVVFIFD